MPYLPRIETDKYCSFITTRCRNSELWFINNPILEEKILQKVTKYSNIYNITLYALAIEGSHIHQIIHTPDKNRSPYMRDQNSTIAKLVPKYCPNYSGGKLWERRYSSQMLAMHGTTNGGDIENYFFYTVLQPVQDGLVKRISEYKGYNCFLDAIYGHRRSYTELDFISYDKAKKINAKVKKSNYETTYHLEYKRLPGYEDLTQKQYVKLMIKKLNERQDELIRAREAEGLGFLGAAAMALIVPGTPAINPKKSERYSLRPQGLSACKLVKQEIDDFVFDQYSKHKIASFKYREGDFNVEFPPGMYRPYVGPPKEQ